MICLANTALSALAQGSTLAFSCYLTNKIVAWQLIAGLSVTTALVQRLARSTFQEKLKNREFSIYCVGKTFLVSLLLLSSPLTFLVYTVWAD